MIRQIKWLASSYFHSKWMPAACFFVFLAVFSVVALLPSLFIGGLVFAGLGMFLVGILFASLWNIIKKRWIVGVVNLIVFWLCTAAVFVVVSGLMVISLFGPSEDGFADRLIIPDDIIISEPKEELQAKTGGPEDMFQANLLTSIEKAGGEDVSVAANVQSLVNLQTKNPEILKRYLATSPAWRMFRENGCLFATRRWMIDSEWCYTLHGYYTKYDIGIWSEIPYFQSRLTIGLSGRPWAKVSETSTQMRQGEVRSLTLLTRDQMQTSHCVISHGDIIAEIYEQSKVKERCLTKAALVYLENEMIPLAENPSWETIRAGFPPGTIKQGEASFELRKSSQPGIYNSYIWVNPGESGMIFLKAFEVIKGTPLSVDSLKNYSGEWIGWSNMPEELFFSNTHITIYEGDWGKPYAGRFEVWFVPDSGSPERKLMEKIFKIEGWQR